MHKVNFLNVFDHDTATEELCASVAQQYRVAAKLALEKSGSTLVLMKESNPDVHIQWHYRSSEMSHNKYIQPTQKTRG